MWWNEIEWNREVYNKISLFELAKKLMEWNGTQWDQFHSIPLNPSIFHSPQFEMYPMKWNFILLILLFYPYFISLFLFSNTHMSHEKDFISSQNSTFTHCVLGAHSRLLNSPIKYAIFY
jgi:hypothetical protein